MKFTRSKIVSLATTVALLGMSAGLASLSTSIAAAAVGGPTVVLSTTASSTTSATSAPVVATFSQAVSGFTSSDVSVTNGSVSNFSGSGSVYSFSVSPTASGTVSVLVPADAASSTASSTGNQASNTLAINFTTAAPVISNVAVSNISTSSATITWTTDVSASSQVFWGTTASYGQSSTLNTTASTTHSVTLSNLSEGTLYHYQVVSAAASSTASSVDAVFVTQSTASSTPLAVTGVDTVRSSATADGSFSDGWQWTMHLNVPDNENAFRMKFTDFTMTGNSSTTIPAGSNIRIFTAQSSNAFNEATAITSTNNNYGGWIYLNGDTGTTTPGRQIDLTIQVRIPVGTPAGSYSTIFTAQSTPQNATSTTP